MEEKEVVRKKRSYKKRKIVSRAKKAPMQKPKIVYIRGPGIVERALMRLTTILKSLIGLIEKKIQKLRAKRLAKRMGGDDKI